jgi:hypothetical protein
MSQPSEHAQHMTPPADQDESRLKPIQVLVILLLGLLARAGYEVAVRTDEGPVGALTHHLLGDERAYDEFARASAEGALDRERAFYQEPMYPWLLGVVYRLWPPMPVAADAASIPREGVRDAVLWVQHLLGLLVAWGTARLGARALGNHVGFLAGVFMAVSGPAVFHESMLLKATLSLLLVVISLNLWLDLLESAGKKRAVVLGLCLGIGVLLRGNLYLLLALVTASLVLRRASRRPAEALLVLGTALLVMAPATLHNIQRGDFVLTTYQAGSNAAIGQPIGADPNAGIMYTPLRAGRGDARFEEKDAVRLAEAGAGRRLTGREISAWWWTQVGEQLKSHPLVALQRTGWKLLHLFHGLEVVDVKDWTFISRRVPWLNTPLSNLWLLGPWALLGFLFLPWRKHPGLLVVRGGLVVFAMSLALFYVMGRYRLTALPMLFILAAGAASAGWHTLRSNAPLARKGLVLLGALGLPLALAALPMPTESHGHHVSWANASSVERRMAEEAEEPGEALLRRERARLWASKAIEIAPLFPSARTALLFACSSRGPALEPLPSEARDAAWRLALLMEGLRTGRPVRNQLDADEPEVARTVIELLDWPSLPGQKEFTGPLRATAMRSLNPWFKPGQMPYIESSELFPLALRLANLSLDLDPGDPMGYAQRGLVLRRMHRLPEAEKDYRTAIQEGAVSATLHNNLGTLLLDTGRPAEAQESFLRALELSPDNPIIQLNLGRSQAALESSRDP